VKNISELISGTIWNIELSTSGAIMAIEIRDEENKKVLFSIYDLEKEEWLWKNIEFEEAWWINLLAIDEERLYLNYFTDEENPQSKKIIVVDIETKEVVNELNEFKEFEKNKLLKLPFHYVEGSVNFDKVAHFVEQHCADKTVKAIDYLQTHSAIAISYYIYNEEELVNFLLILNLEGEEVEREKLGEGLSKVGMQTFFQVNNCLIAIKNKIELKIYKL